MQHDQAPLSPRAVVGFARELFSANNFQVGTEHGFSAPSEAEVLLAEDEYSFIALVAFETWSHLAAEWPDVQAELVAFMTRRLSRSSPKAWDGYLILTCADTPTDHGAVSQIERDTSRLRKIVGTAETLRTTGDVARILDPFLPLETPNRDAIATDVLEALPLLLDGVPPEATRAVVEAYRSIEPPLERLHKLDLSR